MILFNINFCLTGCHLSYYYQNVHVFIYTVFIRVAGQAKERWNNLRSSYIRSKKRMKDWYSAPSGSAAKKKAKPQAYKFAGDLCCLDEEAALEVEDTLQPSGSSHSVTPLLEVLSEVSI